MKLELELGIEFIRRIRYSVDVARRAAGAHATSPSFPPSCPPSLGTLDFPKIALSSARARRAVAVHSLFQLRSSCPPINDALLVTEFSNT